MAQPTPGEWLMVKGDGTKHGVCRYITPEGEHFALAAVYNQEEKGEALANARLIVAAKDLLNACRIAYEHLDTYGVVTGGHEREYESQDAAFQALISAMKKAEGAK
jgi:hypothetical protein